MNIAINIKSRQPVNQPRQVAGYVIDNIFDPPKQRRYGLTAALRSMAIGESLLIKHEQRGHIGPTKALCHPMRFTQSTMEHGIRLWRIE